MPVGPPTMNFIDEATEAELRTLKRQRDEDLLDEADYTDAKRMILAAAKERYKQKSELPPLPATGAPPPNQPYTTPNMPSPHSFFSSRSSGGGAGRVGGLEAQSISTAMDAELKPPERAAAAKPSSSGSNSNSSSSGGYGSGSSSSTQGGGNGSNSSLRPKTRFKVSTYFTVIKLSLITLIYFQFLRRFTTSVAFGPLFIISQPKPQGLSDKSGYSKFYNEHHMNQLAVQVNAQKQVRNKAVESLWQIRKRSHEDPKAFNKRGGAAATWASSIKQLEASATSASGGARGDFEARLEDIHRFSLVVKDAIKSSAAFIQICSQGAASHSGTPTLRLWAVSLHGPTGQSFNVHNMEQFWIEGAQNRHAKPSHDLLTRAVYEEARSMAEKHQTDLEDWQKKLTASLDRHAPSPPASVASVARQPQQKNQISILEVGFADVGVADTKPNISPRGEGGRAVKPNLARCLPLSHFLKHRHKTKAWRARETRWTQRMRRTMKPTASTITKPATSKTSTARSIANCLMRKTKRIKLNMLVPASGRRSQAA